MMSDRLKARKLSRVLAVLIAAVGLVFVRNSRWFPSGDISSKVASCIGCSFEAQALKREDRSTELMSSLMLKSTDPGVKSVALGTSPNVLRTNEPLQINPPSGLYDTTFFEQELLSTIEQSGSVVPRENVTRIIILTQARSGSTFVAHLIGRAPKAFVVQEPFFERKGAERLNDSYFETQKYLLRDLFLCSFSSYKKKPEPFFRWMYHRNALRRYCKSFQIDFCTRCEFLNKICERSKVIAVKTVRLHLSQLRSWMKENADLGPFTILHLTRDPRAIMASRSRVRGLAGNVKCMDPATLCNDMKSDVKEFETLKRRFPNTTFQVRFEDLVQNLESGARTLYAALHLDYTKAVARFLNDAWRSTDEGSNDYGLVRDPSMVAFRWLSELPYRKIVAYQKLCYDVLPMLGYLHVNGSKDRLERTPVLSRPVVT